MTDPGWAKKQLDAAAALSQQAVGYRVLLGRDVYDEPRLLPELLTKESVL